MLDLSEHHWFPLHLVLGILMSRRWNRDVINYKAQQKQIRFSSSLLFRWVSVPALQSPLSLSVSQSWLCDASAMCFVLLSPWKEKVYPPPEVSDYTEETDRGLCTRASNVTSTVIKAIQSTKTSVMGQSRPSSRTCAYCWSPILTGNVVYSLVFMSNCTFLGSVSLWRS